MTVFANLVDGEIKGVYDLLPKFWNGHSNFNIICANNADFMRENGFVRIVKQDYSYDPETHYLSSFPTYTIENGEVIEHRAVMERPVYIEPEVPVETLLEQVRQQRDQLMRDFDWRYNRYHRQLRLGLETTDTLEELDAYMQALADITLQEDLNNLTWPTFVE